MVTCFILTRPFCGRHHCYSHFAHEEVRQREKVRLELELEHNKLPGFRAYTILHKKIRVTYFNVMELKHLT